MKRLFVLAVVFIIIVSLSACNKNIVRGSIVKQTDEGAAVLDIMPQKLFEIAEMGDIVVVTVGEFREEMPLVDNVIAEEGKLQLFYDSNEHSLKIFAYNQDFFEEYNFAINSKVNIKKQ